MTTEDSATTTRITVPGLFCSIDVDAMAAVGLPRPWRILRGKSGSMLEFDQALAFDARIAVMGYCVSVRDDPNNADGAVRALSRMVAALAQSQPGGR